MSSCKQHKTRLRLEIMDLAAGDEKRLGQAVCVHGAVIENMPEIILALWSNSELPVRNRIM